MQTTCMTSWLSAKVIRYSPNSASAGCASSCVAYGVEDVAVFVAPALERLDDDTVPAAERIPIGALVGNVQRIDSTPDSLIPHFSCAPARTDVACDDLAPPGVTASGSGE